jgi:hypothetical protein
MFSVLEVLYELIQLSLDDDLRGAMKYILVGGSFII